MPDMSVPLYRGCLTCGYEHRRNVCTQCMAPALRYTGFTDKAVHQQPHALSVFYASNNHAPNTHDVHHVCCRCGAWHCVWQTIWSPASGQPWRSSSSGAGPSRRSTPCSSNQASTTCSGSECGAVEATRGDSLQAQLPAAVTAAAGTAAAGTAAAATAWCGDCKGKQAWSS